MDKLFGLPAHPLLVHIPVVLLPLAAVGVIVMAIRPAWHARYRWVVLGLGAAGTIGAVLAASAGEELERRIIAVEGEAAAASWERHSQLGDTARTVALLFFVVLALFVFVPWWLERRRATDAAAPSPRTAKGIRIAVAALAILGSAATVTTVVRAGHTGSKSVWEDYVAKTGDGS